MSGLADRVATLAPALAATLAMVAMAAARRDPEARAEGLYLTLVAALVLLVVARLGETRRRSTGVSPTLLLPVLSTLALVAVPSGPTRATTLVTLLSIGLAAAILRAVVRAELPAAISFERLIPAAVGVQLLFHSGDLLAPALDLPSLGRWLVWPTLGAAATHLLARSSGRAAALIAAGTALVLTSGWSSSSSLALLALAGGGLLLERGRAEGGPWIAGMGLLLAPLVVGSGLGLVAVLGGLARLGGRIWLAPALVVAALLPLSTASRPWSQVLHDLGWLPLLLPALFVELPAARRRGVLFGLVLAVIALRAIPPPLGLVAPVTLLALQLGIPRPEPTKRGNLAGAGVWTGAWLLGAAVLAAYPWLRAAPLLVVVNELVSMPLWLLAGSVWGLAWVTRLAAPPRGAPSGARSRRSAVTLTVTVAVAAVGAGVALAAVGGWRPETGSRAETLSRWPHPVLNADQPLWIASLDAPIPTDRLASSYTLVVDSALAEASELEAGTVVATVRFVIAGGIAEERRLRVGFETAEWAAGRGDLTARGVPAPAAWLSWVAGDGTFFGQRYRGLITTERAGPVVGIEIERSPALPRAATLTLFHIELRPRFGAPTGAQY